MKQIKLLILFCIVICSVKTIQAQTWNTVTSGTVRTLYSVDFLSPGYGFIVGLNATILQSYNGVTLWGHILTSGSNNMFAVEVIDTNEIIIGSWGGIIQYTNNGGVSWLQYNIDGLSSFFDIHSDYSNNIYLVGYDGSTSGIWKGKVLGPWNRIFSDSAGALRSIDFHDSLSGFAVGENAKVLRTTDGGISWVRQVVPTQNYLWNVDVLNESSAIIVGSGGVILKTTNSGINWVLKESGTTQNLLGISFFDGLKGIAVGDSGIILHTTNGGEAWYPAQSPTVEQLRSVVQPTSNTAVAVGRNGKIVTTSNNAVVSTKESEIKMPSRYELNQNYPNPFNPSTTIQFGIPKDSHVEILLYSIHGELIKELLNEEKKGGYHTVNLDLSMYSTGTYFYKIMAIPYDGSSGFLQTKKLMLLK